MADLACKKCGGFEHVKNGIVRGHQRYLCRACGCNFTATPPRGKPAAMKALAVLLYGLGNVSQMMIGKLLGVSNVAVLNWVRAAAQAMPAIDPVASQGIVVVDEMWHYVNGKKTQFGPGGPMILVQGAPWPGSWVAVMTQPPGSFLTGLALIPTPSSPMTGTAITA